LQYEPENEQEDRERESSDNEEEIERATTHEWPPVIESKHR
jgi:hypothetical protein